MKKIILITIFSLLLLPVKAQWYRKYEAANNLYFNDLYTLNKDTLFIQANNSSYDTFYLKRSFDGGNTWTDFSFQNQIGFLQFVNNTGFMVQGNDLLKTIDFGDSWQTIHTFDFQLNNEFLRYFHAVTDNIFIATIQFTNSNNYTQDRIYISYDGASTWQQIPIQDLSRFYGIYFINELEGFLVYHKFNQAGCILSKTTNSGQTWTTINNNLGDCPLKTKFINQNIGFMVNYNVYKKTTDGGITWEDTNYFIGNRIIFMNENLHWSIICDPPACTGCHIGSYIYKYDNGTVTEFEYITPDLDDYDYCYSQISFPEATTGYVLSDHFLFKNDTGINTGFISKTENLTYEQFKIYPNPNKGIFNIKFDKNPSQNWQYQITNLQGQILINNQQLIDHKIDANRLPAGVYLLNLQNDEKIYTQKIIIQK